MSLLPLLLLLQSSGVGGFATTTHLPQCHSRPSSPTALSFGPITNNYVSLAPLHQQRRQDVLKRVSSILLSRSTNNSNAITDDDFTTLGLSADLVTTITTGMGWTKPTNIQQLAIPAILHMSSSSSIINNKKEAQSDDDDDDNGKDENNYYDSVWCTSPTGSGKTASFALPILQLIIQQKQQQRQEEEDTTGQRRRIKHHHRSQGDGSSKPTALILCPTRELAIQTYSVFMELLSHIHQHQSTTATPVTVRAIYGGTSSSSSSSSEESTASLDIDEIQRLLEGIDDDVDVNDTATASSDMLNGLQYLIIDEADRLLGKAFENEID